MQHHSYQEPVETSTASCLRKMRSAKKKPAFQPVFSFLEERQELGLISLFAQESGDVEKIDTGGFHGFQLGAALSSAHHGGLLKSCVIH